MRPEGESPVSQEMLLAVLDANQNEAQEAPAASASSVSPVQRPTNVVNVASTSAPKPAAQLAPQPRVITRASTSGGRHWGISLGRYTTRNKAERLLLQTALQEIETLDEALRKVIDRPQGWEANFVGMSEERATLACERLSARGVECEIRGPGA
jgi:D-alanyl-D-alanine carboxypeptidase